MEKLHQYNALLVQHNQITNLTAHKTLEQSWLYNVQDSLLFNKEITPFFQDSNSLVKVLDIGSGGGCPAIPLKISFPEIDMTMIDSVGKKVNFLNEVVTELRLVGIRAIHTRIEDFAKTNRESFNIVTARAVAPMRTLLEYALPFLKIGGVFLAFKGLNVAAEILDAKTALAKLGGEIVQTKTAPFEDGAVRSLVIVKKVRGTPVQFPRGKNLPRLKPL